MTMHSMSSATKKHSALLTLVPRYDCDTESTFHAVATRYDQAVLLNYNKHCPQCISLKSILHIYALLLGFASSSPSRLTNKAFFMPGWIGCSSSMTAHAMANLEPSALKDNEATEAGYFGS